MQSAVSWHANSRHTGINELAEAEHLSWKISMGMAFGDAREFDYWFSSLWRDGEPEGKLDEADLVVVVKRPVQQDQRVEWWTYGDWIFGLVRCLNCHYLVTRPELSRMPSILDLELEPAI